MRPQDKTTSSQPSPRDIAVPQRDAAANVVRSQIAALYGDRDAAAANEEPKTEARPQSHANTSHTQKSESGDQWQQYHTAWQKYYQEYYNRYYASHAHKVIEQERQKAPTSTSVAQTINELAAREVPADKKQEVADLRQKIIGKVQDSAKKARKSRHFIPISAAMVVVFIFAFLQYNSLLIGTVQAYVSPGTIDPQNIVVDPTAATQVGPEPKLIIPKINVDVPVVYGVGNDHDSQMAAMQNGVAHFSIPGANSVPGQIGNTVISGHSSNDLFEQGDYKFVFAQLSKLENGDTIYANYESKRYTYTVTKKEIVKPSNVKALTYQTDKPVLTLITCWPLGTADERMLITAEQVSPDPAKAATPDSAGGADAKMPGNSATALERLFGSRG